ncbi:MAG: enoyl-CoA hydratase/isomerase family protein, partial [Dehalococcoidia bacterium]|nr:enoyl-CoA hydratase/isomerase family protein [Dehalococcoidia bacterium]
MDIDYTKEGGIAIFTINRPQVRNALDMESIRALTKAMIDFRDDPELSVGIITGAGDKAFSTGADVTDTLLFMRGHRNTPGTFPATIMRGLDIWKPLIAAINGLCLGGAAELALACDIRIASDNATIGLIEVNMGILPGWGGTQRLPRAIPWAKAAELIFMGRPIDA